MPQGRPSKFTAELASEICLRLSHGETLRQICRDDHMPDESTVRSWVLDDRHGFSTQYARARDMCLEAWADEIVEICDDGTNDWIEREKQKGRFVKEYQGDHVNRSRLRADNRKWLLSKLKPEKYGEKLELSGNLEVKMTDDQLESRLSQLLGKAGINPHSGGEGKTSEEA